MSHSDLPLSATTPAAPRRFPWLEWAAVLAAAAALLWAYGPRTAPLLGDAQLYFHVAERAASGEPFHTAHFDAKQAFASMLDAIAVVAGRLNRSAAGADDVWAGRLWSMTLLLGSAALTVLLAWRLYASRTSAIVAGLALLSSHTLTSECAMGFQPKVTLVFLLLLALAGFDPKHPARSGALAALCFLAWQPALLLAASAAIVLAAGGTLRREWPRALVGFLVPLLLYESCFIATGAWRQQLEQTFYFPARFMSNNFDGWTGAFDSLYTIWAWSHGLLHLLPLFLAAGMAGSAWRWVRRRPGFARECHETPRRALLHVFTLFAAGFTYYDHQGPQDLLFLIPSAALYAGWIAARIAAALAARKPGLSVPAAAAFALYFAGLAALGPWWFRPHFHLADQRRAAAWIGDELGAGHSVYTVGCGHLLSFNHHSNWVRYGFFFRGMEEYLAHRTGQPVFTPERDGRWPDVIVSGRRMPLESDGWLERFYRTETPPPELQRQELRVWRLREKRLAGGE